jgi:chemotaxis signal transduction protein
VVVEVGDEICGLVVDEVGDVGEVRHDTIEPLPSHLPVAQRRWFKGMVQLPNELLLLLDVTAIGRLARDPDKLGAR